MPKRTWKLVLAYDGTPYSGWQIQPGLSTIQGALAEAIRHITGETVLPQGSGRTDAGVHALAQVASFALDSPIPAGNLHRALNRALPPSIRVLSVEAVPPTFHARHSARRKTYEYRIFPRKLNEEVSALDICSPMLAPYVWACPWPLVLNPMKGFARDLSGEHDFTSFAAGDPDLAARSMSVRDSPVDETVPAAARSNVRTIFRSDWSERDGLLVYTVTGSGFLHHMVRNLVGTMVDIGSDRLPSNAIPTILAARDRSRAGPTAPACGLFLVDVEY